MTKTRNRRTYRRVRKQQKSRRRNMRRKYGGRWGAPASFREVVLYKNNGPNNKFPSNLYEQFFNENGEITNTQLNEKLDQGRELPSPGRFVLNVPGIPGITHAERRRKLLTFYAGDEQIGSIIIHELDTGDRGDKPAWMSII